MASGIINGTTSNKYIDSKIEWSSSSSTANNNSVVTASLYYRRNNTYSGTPTSGNGTFGITIDGQRGSTTFSLTIPNSGAWVKAVTVTKTVPHNSDGKRSITISASGSIPVASLTSTTCSGTAVLDNIPRQANITSASDFTDLDNPTIKYSNPAGNSVSELMACISLTGDTSDVGYRTINKVGTSETLSYQFPLTDEERDLLRNNTTSGSRTVYFYVRTKIGNTYYYSKSQAKTLTIKETDNTKPTVSMTTTLDNGSLPSQFNGLYIQGKSKLQVELTATGKYKATIQSYSATLDGKTYNSAKFTTDAIKTVNTITLVGYAKDSRKFTGSTSQSFNVLSYSKPLVIPIGSENAITCYRSDGNGKRVGNSTSVWIKAKRNYQPVTSGGVQKNFCALQWRRKLVNASWDSGNAEHQWYDLIPKSNTTVDEYDALLTGDYVVFELTKSYTVQIRAVDDIGEQDVKTFEIPTQDVALHLGEGGKNVSIGTYCDYSTPYRFYSAWEGKFAQGLWGTSLNYIATDVLKFAEESPDGLTPFITNDTTDRSNLPDGYYAYSVGTVHKRQDGQCYVYLTDYMSGEIAINFLLNGTWSGWKYITPQLKEEK